MVEPLGQDRPIFTAARQVRTYEAILTQFREAITSGRLASGDRLPSQRDLAEQFGVSRAAVLEALRVLERTGLITIKPGARGGAFVRAPNDQLLSDHLDLLLELEQVSLQELLEFRRILEGQNAYWAAQRATANEIAGIEEIVESMAALQGDMTEYSWQLHLEMDTRFHDAVAHAAHNRAVNAVMRGVLVVLTRELKKVPRSTAEKGYSDLREISEAIAARDPVLAQSSVQRHITDFFQFSNPESDGYVPNDRGKGAGE